MILIFQNLKNFEYSLPNFDKKYLRKRCLCIENFINLPTSCFRNFSYSSSLFLFFLWSLGFLFKFLLSVWALTLLLTLCNELPLRLHHHLSRCEESLETNLPQAIFDQFKRQTWLRTRYLNLSTLLFYVIIIFIIYHNLTSLELLLSNMFNI